VQDWWVRWFVVAVRDKSRPRPLRVTSRTVNDPSRVRTGSRRITWFSGALVCIAWTQLSCLPIFAASPGRSGNHHHGQVTITNQNILREIFFPSSPDQVKSE
jgi:hypothetical protein